MNHFKTFGDYQYFESEGKGETIVLLHGLLGTLSNFEGFVEGFGKEYNVVMPVLPLLEWPYDKLSLPNLVDFVKEFIDFKKYSKVHLLGNSLGGHLALLFTLKHKENVQSVTLTGSSGLFESAFGNTFPKRGDYDFIKRKVQDTFYYPEAASQEMIDEVFETVNNREKGLRVVITAKSAVRNNLEDKLQNIISPTLLVWGKQDHITPPFVAEKFNELIANSRLEWIDKCGHAPMMEHPDKFNKIFKSFIEKLVTESKNLA